VCVCVCLVPVQVISDTVTTSSEEAAADPDNLKGKSSDNKPDGLAVRSQPAWSLYCLVCIMIFARTPMTQWHG